MVTTKPAELRFRSGNRPSPNEIRQEPSFYSQFLPAMMLASFQFTLTSICLGLASSALGKVTVRMPSL